MKTITIGRNSDNTIALQQDLKASRYHCTVRQYDDGRITVTDNGSTNGTFVNEQRIAGETPIGLNDTLRVGETNIDLRQYLGGPMPGAGDNGIRVMPPPSKGPSQGLIWGLVGGLIVVLAIVVLFATGVFDKKESKGKEPIAAGVTNDPNQPKTTSPVTQTAEVAKSQKENVLPANFEGTWSWQTKSTSWVDGEEVPDRMLLLALTQKGNKITGSYYSWDAVQEELDGFEYENNTVIGTVEGNQATVTFKSGDLGGSGTATITWNSKSSITWNRTSKKGDCIVPQNVTLKKIN